MSHDSDIESDDEEVQYEIQYIDESTAPHHYVDVNKSGKAVAKFVNGDTYEGEYLNGKRHGYGVYKWINGAVYTGDYNEGQKHGKGKLIYPDGSVYDGEWKHDKRDGEGIYTASNGDVYEGRYVNNKRHGENCIYRYASTHTTVTGRWISGRLVYGTWQYPDGSTYTGHHNKENMSGRGVYQFQHTGNIHTGQYHVEKHVDPNDDTLLKTSNKFIPYPSLNEPPYQAPTIHSLKTQPSIEKQIERQIIRGTLVIDQFEGIHRLKKEVMLKTENENDEDQVIQHHDTAVPNWRPTGALEAEKDDEEDDENQSQSNEPPPPKHSWYACGQPTLDGLRAIVQHLNESENTQSDIVYIDTRSDPYVYINNNGTYSVRDAHTIQSKSTVFLEHELTGEQLLHADRLLADRVKKMGMKHGQLLKYMQQTYGDIPERDIQSLELQVHVETHVDEEVESVDEADRIVLNVYTPSEAVEWINNNENIEIQYYRIPIPSEQSTTLVPSTQQYDTLLNVLKELDLHNTTVIFSSHFGKMDVTLGGVVSELYYNVKNPVEVNEEINEGEEGENVDDDEEEEEGEEDENEKGKNENESEEEEAEEDQDDDSNGEAEDESEKQEENDERNNGDEGDEKSGQDATSESAKEVSPAEDAPKAEQTSEEPTPPDTTPDAISKPPETPYTTGYLYLDGLISLSYSSATKIVVIPTAVVSKKGKTKVINKKEKQIDVTQAPPQWKQLMDAIQSHSGMIHLIDYLQYSKQQYISAVESDDRIARDHWKAVSQNLLKRIASLIVLNVYLHDNVETEFQKTYTQWLGSVKQRKLYEYLHKQTVTLDW